MASASNFGYNIGDILKEYLDDPIFILNKDYEFEYSSDKLHLKNLGLISLKGKITDILHPNDFQRGVDFLQNVSKVEQAVETLRVRYGDNFRFYEFKGRLFKNKAQETKYLITTRDITQFKKKEEDWVKKEKNLRRSAETMQEIRFWKLLQTKNEKSSFQNSREMLDIVIDNIPQFIYWKNKKMIYLGCNQNFALINNLDDPNFIVGKTDIELPWSRANIKRIYERESILMQNNQSENIIESWILPDGNEAWFEINRIPLHNINKDIVGILCTYNNITSRVEAERKSIAFEKKYRQIIDDIKEAYFEVDLKGNFTFSNKSFTQMIGYSFDEMMGKNYRQLMDDENQMKVFEKFNSVYNSGLPQEYFQFEFIKKGNTKVIVETSVYLNKDTFGKKIGFYGISRDITQKFNLELKFKQSEEKYRHLFESSPYAIWIVDLNGELIDCNTTTNVMFSKYTRKDIIGKNFIEVLGMFDRPEYFIPFFKSKFESFVQDKPMKALEFKITRSDGIEKWMNIRSSKIKLGDETLIQVLIQDITEKKKADLKLQRSEEELKILNKELEKKVQERTKELRDSEEKFRTITENSLMGVAIVQDNKVKYVNQQFATLAGYNVDEVKEFSLMDIFQSIHPDDRNLVMEQLRKKQQGLKDYMAHYQYRIFDKTGGVKWVDNYSKTINFMGSPADLVSAIDITDRKNAEQELKESEEKFRTITEYSTFGIIIIQDDKVKYVNKAMVGINEFTIDEMMEWTSKELLYYIHPEDQKQAIEYLKARETGDSTLPPYSSYRIITKSGKFKWIDSYSKTITYLGRFADLALVTDVTYQNLAKQELKESEEKYRLLFENMSAAFAFHEVLVNDDNKPIDYRYLEANSQFEKLTGLKVSDIIGKKVTELLPGIENDTADWIGKFGNVALTGEPLTVEDYSAPLDRWYNVSGYSPKKGFFAVTFNDITDRKKAEQELKESEEKYRHLYENSPFSIVLLNYDGKIIDMNPKTTELFGYKKEDLIDKNYLNLIDIFPKETKLELRLITDLMSKGEPSNPIMKPQITKIYSKDKKPVWIESELSTVRISGELMILTIIQDITEKKLAEEKLKESEQILRQQNIELKELDRLKTDFITIAAHDLKTPLISVGGYIDLILLREKGLNEEVKEDLNRVLNNVQRLDGYINRLLDVMKIEAKKVELVKREENIHDIIKNCISDLEFQIGQKNLTINLDISENLKLRVDHFRISQAFLNLLSNAIKFTPKNGKIDISIVEEHESVLFKITDNGIGLTPEEIQKIFGKFVTIEQGVAGHSTLNKGTGLGLYIAKGFIEAHGGKIWVESKGRDMGAEFSFILPKQ